MFKAAVALSLLTTLLAPTARAADEVNEAHSVLEVGAARGIVLGRPLNPYPSYTLTALRLWEGKGVGARLMVLPVPDFSRPTEFSTTRSCPARRGISRFTRAGWQLHSSG